MSNKIRHPEVEVQLSGEDGNAFMIVGRTQRAMRRAGLHEGEVTEYAKEATSGDYDNVLATTQRWVTVL